MYEARQGTGLNAQQPGDEVLRLCRL
eukprot:COSAG06_NODE_23419_length_692_cov_1.185497_2_plen_25_part_01